MNEPTLITMHKDVFEYILQMTRASALQDRNIHSLTELVKARKVCTNRKLTVTKGGKWHE